MEKLINLLEKNGKGKIVLKDSLPLYEVHKAIHEGRAFINEDNSGYVYLEEDDFNEKRKFNAFKKKCAESCRSHGDMMINYGGINISAENIAKEIDDCTAFGINILDDFMQLTFDKISRDKIKIEEVKTTYLLIYTASHVDSKSKFDNFYSTFPGFSHCQDVKDIFINLNHYLTNDFKDVPKEQEFMLYITILKYKSNDEESYYSNSFEVSSSRLSKFLNKRL